VTDLRVAAEIASLSSEILLQLIIAVLFFSQTTLNHNAKEGVSAEGVGARREETERSLGHACHELASARL